MTERRVDLELDGPIAVVTLQHGRFNLFDVAMRDALIEAITAVRDVTWLRAMILRADGEHFCAGADLGEFGNAASIAEARRIRWDRDPWGPLWDLPVPTVAALHGVTLGSGLEMALLCDIRLAASDTRLGLPETKLGMLPAAGGTQSLTRAIGPHAALPLVLTAATIGAEDALARGVVHEVVDNVDVRARAIATRLALVDRDLLGAARRLCHAAGDLPLPAGLEVERRLAARFPGNTRSAPSREDTT